MVCTSRKLMWHEKKTRCTTCIVRWTLLSAPTSAQFNLCSSRFLLGAVLEVPGLHSPAWEKSQASLSSWWWSWSAFKKMWAPQLVTALTGCHCLLRNRINGVCIPGNGLGLKSRGFILLPPPVCYRFNSSSVSEEFWRGRGGGGKIYFKLSSSLIHISFMMYFYQQHFAIQLPLLNVIFLSKKM